MEGSLLAPWGAPHPAPATLPPGPRRRDSSAAQQVGAGVLGVTLAALGVLVIAQLREQPKRPRARTKAGTRRDHVRAARYLSGAASILSFSVLTDSALEHYRGTFHNPGMVVAPVVAAASFANNLEMLARPERSTGARLALCVVSLATGILGTGFHVYNVAKREGGFGLLNLFYGAPIGAPAAIGLAGFYSAAAAQLMRESGGRPQARILGSPAGIVLGLSAVAGMIGTVAEAGLLHLRGAFHNPAMYLPVSLPPLAAAALAAATAKRGLLGLARQLLRATALLGLIGAGFHLYGVRRNMGGFYNWSQNILQGPPVPAPPGFTGVALAGLAAVKLMERN